MKNLKHNTEHIVEAPPVEEKSEQVPYDTSRLLARMDKIESNIQLVKDSIDFVKGTNWFILVVLFIGFLALITSFISGIIQATNNNTAAQKKFIKSVDQLNDQLNNLEFTPTKTLNNKNTK